MSPAPHHGSARIPLAGVDALSLTGRDFLARRGELNVFRLLAGAPRAFDGWTRMVDALLDSDTFTVSTRELVILRVAHLCRSDYELAQHTDLARAVGITDAQIAAATGPAPGDGPDTSLIAGPVLDQGDAAVLVLVTELVETGTVSGDRFAEVHTRLGTAALVELLLLVNLYYGLALILNAARTPIDPDARLDVSR